MARTRAVKIGFFQNEQLAALSPYHRLLFQGLWLIADRHGRLEDRPKRIGAELFPYERDLDIDRFLDELARCGFIDRYEVNQCKVIAIPNFSKHQRPHPHEASFKLPEKLPGNVTALPENSPALPVGIWDLGSGSVGSGIRDLGNGRSLSEGIAKYQPIPLGETRDQSENSESAEGSYSSAFLEFWNLYPKRTGKTRAWQAWQDQRPDITVVVKALAWQVKSDDWNREEGRYRPSPALYLEERRWEDEPPDRTSYVPDARTNEGRMMLAGRRIVRGEPFNPFGGES